MTHDNDTERGGIIRTLRELLEIVATESQRHEDGSSSRGPTELGYEYSISTGNLSEFEPRSARPQNVPSPSDRPIAVRYEDEDVLVTIDIPEIDPERVSTSVSDDELLLGIDGTVEERIPLGRQLLTIDTSNLTNGVLEFRLRPTEEKQ
ncbi:gas vesicle protein GvpH [Halocatena pleomorpha]|uniref:Uncharacterized protein n=1 Tax=Halocatena pleomorpha TaxID=1785090 RepID=A0A3P3RDZ4_9EURY|nr:gas vesicle protein GvpH [Halocatena pleomorpha]RRJ31564.1 hypothetical protein EIK79_07585 [Halocatena pleomorpha]